MSEFFGTDRVTDRCLSRHDLAGAEIAAAPGERSWLGLDIWLQDFKPAVLPGRVRQRWPRRDFLQPPLAPEGNQLKSIG